MSHAANEGGLRKPKTVYFTMAHTPMGVKRVGRAYSSRGAARDWVPFVRGAWNCRVTVRKLVIRFTEDGQIDEETKRRLDREFNMNPPKEFKELDCG